MTLNQVVQQLEGMPFVEMVSSSEDWKPQPTKWGFELIEIPYLRKFDNGVLFPESITVAVKDKDTVKEKVEWWKAIPRPFRDEVTIPEQRDAYKSDIEYQADIQTLFKIKTLKLSVRVDNGVDQLHVTGVDEKGVVVSEVMYAYMEKDKLEIRRSKQSDSDLELAPAK